jgi:hypothetical protein
MRLAKARVRKYRSIHDSGWFDLEHAKTILVGPNEAGKTALLQALQKVNKPDGVDGFNALRDYPRGEYNDITTGKVDPSKVTVVEAHFKLEPSDQELVSEKYRDCTYVYGRKLDNGFWHHLNGGPEIPTFGAIRKDILRLSGHVDRQFPKDEPETEKPSVHLKTITDSWTDETAIQGEQAAALVKWLDDVFHLISETNKTEENRYERLKSASLVSKTRNDAMTIIHGRLPVFVLYNNYFRVRPLIHLQHLADRIDSNILDDDEYDYGNQCLLKLLGFTARELSDLGKANEPVEGSPDALQSYRDQLDRRRYQLNAASVRLTDEIRSVWMPSSDRDEADGLLVQADGQYLKVVVEDDLGIEIELDQRSEGFQWLVSFFVVFFAEAADGNENAILLLDEPGLSLHGLKQRDFRMTISRLAEANQTVYSTHSPFLVGPDELDRVRVVQMTDRKEGTKVHTTVSGNDPAALLPLQEALGYDLAQSLFAQQRNLVLEGLTDYWYLDALSLLLRESGDTDLNDRIALVPAGNAGKVVYFATILYAQKLKVAALLDSDTAGEQSAKQETLVHTLGNKRILRTKDAYSGAVSQPEIEDLLRETLVQVATDELGWDVAIKSAEQPNRPIVELFADEIGDFSKYRLAKAFLRWARTHEAHDLTDNERAQWKKLIELVNKALK